MNALLLVDIQYDFLPGGALPVPDGDRVVPLANRLMPCFGLILATQDWHPADHKSFASQHPGKSPGDRIELDGLPQILWPDHCVQGTHGAELAAALETARIEQVFRKGTDADIDSYSGFFDNGHRRDTGLGDYLKRKKVNELYIAGLATDYCVTFTALDARKLGFQTLLIEDGCRGVDLHPGDIAHALQQMRQAGVEIIHSGSLTRES